MLTQTTAVMTVGRLFLARLLVPLGKRPTPSALGKSLAPLFKDRFRDSEWQALFKDTLAKMEDDGLLTRSPLTLTEAGRSVALEFLGVDQLPPSLNWKRLKSTFLVPLALGLSPSDPKARSGIANADGLRAQILQRKYDLPPLEKPSLSKTLDALIGREFNLDPAKRLTFNGLRSRVLGKMLDVPGDCSMKDLKKQLPANAIQARRTGSDDLRMALLHDWISGITSDIASGSAQESTGPTQPEPIQEPATTDHSPSQVPSFSLPQFANRVQELANHSPTGRYGDNKVFISHVWKQYRQEAGQSDRSFDQFKSYLCDANQQELLTLSRADLPEYMDLADVQASETRFGDVATFHFILIKR